ncbi:hypothetical protein GCM10008967_00910 [Bacillus carboniphilus]|uniref:NERD domain-containing protein n=1 Tax=Bacillus carboniphilus TaxID=86663 RepID=A0ABN0VPT8_9BACI
MRSTLTNKERQYCKTLEKGFEGEKKLSELLISSNIEGILLHDLNLEHNNTHVQVDTLLITNERLYLLDAKNNEGDYYIKNRKWYSPDGEAIRNPLVQLERTEPLVRAILQNLGSTNPLQENLVFVNPDFHLYNAPSDLPIIYPTQVNRFIHQIEKQATTQIHSKWIKLAHVLINRCLPKSPYARSPKYDFESLRKGIVCEGCRGFMSGYENKTVVCGRCGYIKGVNTAVLRSVEEFRILFPDWKITTGIIYRWCNCLITRKVIFRILSSNFKSVGTGKRTYYESGESKKSKS